MHDNRSECGTHTFHNRIIYISASVFLHLNYPLHSQKELGCWQIMASLIPVQSVFLQFKQPPALLLLSLLLITLKKTWQAQIQITARGIISTYLPGEHRAPILTLIHFCLWNSFFFVPEFRKIAGRMLFAFRKRKKNNTVVLFLNNFANLRSTGTYVLNLYHGNLRDRLCYLGQDGGTQPKWLPGMLQLLN